MLEDYNEQYYTDLLLHVLGGRKVLETRPPLPNDADSRMKQLPRPANLQNGSQRQSYIQPPTPDFSFGGLPGVEMELRDIRDNIKNIVRLFQLENQNRDAIHDRLNNEIQKLFCMVENQEKRIRDLEARLKPSTTPLSFRMANCLRYAWERIVGRAGR